MNPDGSTFFWTEGTLRPGAASYVERHADTELRRQLRSGTFCYVLTASQMGKSSLMVRTAARLRSEGVRTAVLDLMAFGRDNLSPEQWYDGLLLRVGEQLGLEDELEKCWIRYGRLSPVHRWFSALRRVALPADERPLVIFVDEIDIVRGLPFRVDEFFSGIRECYQRRIEDPQFERLTFCLLGMATPAELIQDRRMTPFNLGVRIPLTDFTPAEAAALAPGMGAGASGTLLLNRVLHWTNGHPYLTQRLCRAVAEACAASGVPSDPPGCRQLVDDLCHDLFLSSRARERDDNLLFVRHRLLGAEGDCFSRLQLLGQVLIGQRIADDEANPLMDQLRLSGVIRVESGRLVLRNRIYERVFDSSWLKAHLPDRPAMARQSVAVLPFLNLTGQPDDDYLADGLTDELIMSVGRVPGLRVASRTSVFQFRGRYDDARRIGGQLGVTLLVEGSLRRTDQGFRLTAQLVRVVDGWTVRAEELGCPPDGLDAAQAEISSRVIGMVTAELGVQSALALPPPRRNPGAYQLYLKGLFHWNQRTPAGLWKSVECFQEALRLDPACALAHAGLANAWTVLANYSQVPAVEACPKAREEAERALKLDPNLAEARTALASVLAVHYWNWSAAEGEFRKAIALNPNYSVAHHWFAINCLTPLARHEEALTSLRLAREVDPLGIQVIASVGLALHYAGRAEEARRHCRETIELNPEFYLTHLFLGWIHEQGDAVEEALTCFRRAVESSGGDPVARAAEAHGLARAGKTDEARRRIKELTGAGPSKATPATELAAIHVALGEPDQALRWLARSLEERSLRSIYLLVDPRFKPLRPHAAFQRLLGELHLVPTRAHEEAAGEPLAAASPA